MRKREGNRPDRRIEPAGTYSAADLAALAARVSYVGSALHKLHPGDYGFIPSVSPLQNRATRDSLWHSEDMSRRCRAVTLANLR